MFQQCMKSHKHSLPVSFQFGKNVNMEIQVQVAKYPWELDENVESEHTSKSPGFQSLSGTCEELLQCEVKNLLTQWD